MCRALGAEVWINSAITQDSSGSQVLRLLDESGINSNDLLQFELDRPTTTKTRLIGIASGKHRQQLQRIDREKTHAINPDHFRLKNLDRIVRDGGRFDCVVVSDYDKGFCTPETISGLQRFGPVIVDPPKSGNWRAKYVGMAGCFVPNRAEAGNPQTIDEARCVASEMQETLTAQAVIVKLDADGCVLATKEGQQSIPTQVQEIIDVCGAGDQFIATLAVARAEGRSWLEACEMANHAAGLQCQRFGCDPIERSALESSSQTDVSTRSISATSPCSAKPGHKAII